MRTFVLPYDTITIVATPPSYLHCSIVASLMVDVSISVMFSAVLDHLLGPEIVPPLSHLPDHASVPPQYALYD